MKLDQVIREVVRIPPAPQILPKLQSLMRDPESDLDDIAKLLKIDVSITAEVLKLANSSYFGFASPVTSLEQAMSLIGFKEIFRLVSLTAAGTALKEALPFYNSEEGEFFGHSVATAQIMTAIAEERQMADLDSYYTIGLLHGIGKIVINQYFQSRGLSVYGSNSLNGSTDHEVTPAEERQLFGYDHAEAGAAVLVNWRFSKEIVTPIRYQHEPGNSGDYSLITAALELSRENAPLLKKAGMGHTEWKLPEAAGCLQLDNGELETILARAHKKYMEINQLLKTGRSN